MNIEAHVRGFINWFIDPLRWLFPSPSSEQSQVIALLKDAQNRYLIARRENDRHFEALLNQPILEEPPNSPEPVQPSMVSWQTPPEPSGWRTTRPDVIGIAGEDIPAGAVLTFSPGGTLSHGEFHPDHFSVGIATPVPSEPPQEARVGFPDGAYVRVQFPAWSRSVNGYVAEGWIQPGARGNGYVRVILDEPINHSRIMWVPVEYIEVDS